MKINYLIVLTGPTAVGKTDFSIRLARDFSTSIISADSRQVYRELKIGTAPPRAEQLNEVKHWFIGHRSIHDYYNASMYEVEVLNKLSEVFDKQDIVLLVGGSMLYIDAVCRGIDDLPSVDMELRAQLYQRLQNEGIESLRFELRRIDPDYYRVADLKNPKRILKALEVSLQTGSPYSSFLQHTPKRRDFEVIMLGLNRERAELHERIGLRVEAMLDQGLEAEARSLFAFAHLNSLNTVGYKELFAHFRGEMSLEQAVEKIKRNSRQYARRQISWFNQKPGFRWFHPDDYDKVLEYIKYCIYERTGN